MLESGPHEVVCEGKIEVDVQIRFSSRVQIDDASRAILKTWSHVLLHLTDPRGKPQSAQMIRV